MNSFLDQLNLTPQERRIVVVIAAVVFVVLNWLLVWPHFNDLAQVKQQLNDTRKKMVDENKAIALDLDPTTNGYKNILNSLEQKQGGGIANQQAHENLQVQLQRTITDQARANGVVVDETRAVTSIRPETNSFYEEQSVRISFACQEPQLVNFLYTIGNDAAMIRVRELNLKIADANRYGLKGDAVLTANYAKQPPKSATAPVTNAPAAPAAKPQIGKPPGVGPNKPPGKVIPIPKAPFNPNNAPGPTRSRKNL